MHFADESAKKGLIDKKDGKGKTSIRSVDTGTIEPEVLTGRGEGILS